VPRHRGRCPLAVQRVRIEPSIRVASYLRSAHPRWRPQGLAPPSSPLLRTGSPLPAARRLRRALRRFSQVLRPILPWACVAFRALPRRSADWLPCLRTQRMPRHRGSAAVAGGSPYDCALPRTNRGLDALVGSRASPSTTDPENRLRGARRDAARGGVWVVVLPATSLWLCEPSPSPRRRRSCSVRSTGFPLPRPRHVPSGRSLPVAPPPSRPRHRGDPAGAVRPPCTEVWRERTDHRRGADRSACSEEPAVVRAESPRGLRGRCAPSPRRRSSPLLSCPSPKAHASSKRVEVRRFLIGPEGPIGRSLATRGPRSPRRPRGADRRTVGGSRLRWLPVPRRHTPEGERLAWSSGHEDRLP